MLGLEGGDRLRQPVVILLLRRISALTEGSEGAVPHRQRVDLRCGCTSRRWVLAAARGQKAGRGDAAGQPEEASAIQIKMRATR